MRRAVRVRRRARTDLDNAVRWYESQRPGLGSEFLGEVEQSFSRISDNPESHPAVYRATRRALLSRFPFGVFYRIHGEAIVIVALMHGSRHPRRWMRRE